MSSRLPARIQVRWALISLGKAREHSFMLESISPKTINYDQAYGCQHGMSRDLYPLTSSDMSRNLASLRSPC